MGGCTEELQLETSGTNGAGLDEGELTEAVLNLSVNTFAVEAQAKTRASLPSDTPEKETSEEKEIHNIWVFQYDATTKELLIKPRYYTIADQAMLQDLPVYLKAGVPSIVYVVTNTSYDNWANDGTDTSWQKFKNLEQLKKQTQQRQCKANSEYLPGRDIGRRRKWRANGCGSISCRNDIQFDSLCRLGFGKERR